LVVFSDDRGGSDGSVPGHVGPRTERVAPKGTTRSVHMRRFPGRHGSPNGLGSFAPTAPM
jgi:hypothetical protein